MKGEYTYMSKNLKNKITIAEGGTAILVFIAIDPSIPAGTPRINDTAINIPPNFLLIIIPLFCIITLLENIFNIYRYPNFSILAIFFFNALMTFVLLSHQSLLQTLYIFQPRLCINAG